MTSMWLLPVPLVLGVVVYVATLRLMERFEPWYLRRLARKSGLSFEEVVEIKERLDA